MKAISSGFAWAVCRECQHTERFPFTDIGPFPQLRCSNCKAELGRWSDIGRAAPGDEHPLQTRWPYLTDEDIRTIGNDREKLIVRIVERYAIAPMWVREQVAAWEEETSRPAISGISALKHTLA